MVPGGTKAALVVACRELVDVTMFNASLRFMVRRWLRRIAHHCYSMICFTCLKRVKSIMKATKAWKTGRGMGARELLDIKQAARFLKVSETSLRRWTNAGRLACLRVGGRRERRFRRADLLAMMEEQPAVAHAGHLCGLYADHRGRVSQAAGFLADGLHPGSVCFLVAAPEVRDAVVEQLKQRRPSLSSDIDAGRLVLSEYAASADAQNAYWESRFLGAVRAGAHSLRVVGDVSGGRIAQRAAFDAVLDYEVGYDRRFRRFPLVTLCQYDARTLSGLDTVRLLKCHEDVFRYPADRLLT